jgi:hypothetical protein
MRRDKCIRMIKTLYFLGLSGCRSVCVCLSVRSFLTLVWKPNPIFRLNPALPDKVFFSSDSVTRGPRLTYPGGCGVLILEEFEKSKMASGFLRKITWKR